MRTFKFPLESLRTLRQQRESTAQQAYARALAKCDSAMRLLLLAEEALKAAREMLGRDLQAGAPAARIANLRTWCAALEIRCQEGAAFVAEARRNAGQAQRLMTAAAREREALDRFHDKAQRHWQREFQTEEQKMFDELAVQRQSTGFEKSLLN
jgi:flagellar export protein FliJ